MKLPYCFVVVLLLASCSKQSGNDCQRLVLADKPAFNVCLKLAMQGDAYAQNIVGVSYATGDEVQKNSVEAVYWYKKSANQGFAKAQSNFGNAYFLGFGLGKSMKQAIYWWSEAAKQGEIHAMHNLKVALRDCVACT